MVRVLFFASYRELIKTAAVEIDIGKPVNLSQLIDELVKKYPTAGKIMDSNPLIAVNHEFADLDKEIGDGDEIAFIPPMAGGSSAQLVRIQKADISVDSEIALAKKSSKEIGAIALFLGTARNISKEKKIMWLKFEHYPEMAEKQLNKIRKEALARFNIIEVGIVHRIGHIDIGDNIVLITVASKHRKDAFPACSWCIDELKKITPIWKKEMTEGGAVWVEEHP